MVAMMPVGTHLKGSKKNQKKRYYDKLWSRAESTQPQIILGWIQTWTSWWKKVNELYSYAYSAALSLVETQISRELGWRRVQARALLPGGHPPLYPTEEGIGGFLATSLFWYTGKAQDNKHASDLKQNQLADRKMFIHSPRKENLSNLFIHFNKTCFPLLVEKWITVYFHAGSSTLQ